MSEPGNFWDFMTGQEIYENFTNAPGPDALSEAKTHFDYVAKEYRNLEHEVKGLLGEMEERWTGEASGAAVRGAGPLAVQHARASEALDTTSGLLERQSQSFFDTKNRVVPVPPVPDSIPAGHNIFEDPGKFVTYNEQMQASNDAADQNVVAMDYWTEASSYNGSMMPTEYGSINSGEMNVGLLPPPTPPPIGPIGRDWGPAPDPGGNNPGGNNPGGNNPGGGGNPGGSLPGGGGQSDGSPGQGSGSRPGDGTTPGGYQPTPGGPDIPGSPGGSGVPGYQPGDQRYQPAAGLNAGIGGFGSGVPGSGSGAGGSGSGGRGSGGGGSGFGGGGSAADRLGAGRGSGAVPGSIGEPTGRGGGTGPGSSGGRPGAPGMGTGMGGGQKGAGGEDADHQRKYVMDGDDHFQLVDEDEKLIDPRTGFIVTPPVIGL